MQDLAQLVVTTLAAYTQWLLVPPELGPMKAFLPAPPLWTYWLWIILIVPAHLELSCFCSFSILFFPHSS